MVSRRLKAAEAAVPALAERHGDDTALPALEAHIYRLCQPLGLLAGVKAVAEHRAIRRALLEGRPLDWTGRPPEWHASVQREREALPAFLDAVTVDDVMAALGRWADAPDREGWPVHRGIVQAPEPPTGVALLRQRMAHTRQLANSHRRQDRPGAVAWRRDHPTWRDAMTDEELTEWELTVLAGISPEEEGGHDGP